MEFPDPNSLKTFIYRPVVRTASPALRPAKVSRTARGVSKIGLERRQSFLFGNRDRVLIYDLDRLS